VSPDYGINYAVAKIYIGCTVVLGILPSLCGIQAVHSLGLSIKIYFMNANCIPIRNLSFQRGEKSWCGLVCDTVYGGAVW